MAEPDYMVIRPAADLPDGFLPDGMDGKWFDRSQLPKGPGDGHATTARMGAPSPSQRAVSRHARTER